jgi:hypothetical protein
LNEFWRRHANPWSVWTRFAAIPATILAVWSRVWLGWWALVPVAAVVAWLIINPVAFRAVDEPISWVSKAVYGEQIWLTQRGRVPVVYLTIMRWLVAVGLAGFFFIGWGLWALDVWPTVYGATLVVFSQLWQLDRMRLLYDELESERSGDPSAV